MKGTKHMLIDVPHSQEECLFAGHLSLCRDRLLCRDLVVREDLEH